MRKISILILLVFTVLNPAIGQGDGPLKTLKEFGFVQVQNQNISISLPFDLHGFDCGAPDCYTTLVTFNWSLSDSPNFPSKLPYVEKDSGCGEDGTPIKGTFNLVISDSNTVHLQDKINQRNLIIKSSDQRKEFVYYFTEMDVEISRFDQLMAEINERDSDAQGVVPFRISTVINRD